MIKLKIFLLLFGVGPVILLGNVPARIAGYRIANSKSIVEVEKLSFCHCIVLFFLIYRADGAVGLRTVLIHSLVGLRWPGRGLATANHRSGSVVQFKCAAEKKMTAIVVGLRKANSLFVGDNRNGWFVGYSSFGRDVASRPTIVLMKRFADYERDRV